jgi:selenocysteine lyase/cysteine desulfurase
MAPKLHRLLHKPIWRMLQARASSVNVCVLGDSLTVELSALTRAVLVRIQVPQPTDLDIDNIQTRISAMISCQRHLFDVPDDIAYFNCAAFSPILKTTRDAGMAGAARKAQPWNLGNKEFAEEPDRARALFAGLIGAPPQDVAIVPATSYGIATAAANLPVKPGERIVLLGDQYPNNVLPWIEKRNREGAELVFVDRADGDDLTSGILQAIDERTAIAALPHCFWTDGTLIDLPTVGRRCREMGAALVVDATQSVGALPLDIVEVRPDFLVVSGYKWLLCPYTIGFLYVAPHRQDGLPLENGWSDRVQTEGGSDWQNGHMHYPEGWQQGAGRFNMGETANFIAMPMAIKALEQLQTWTVSDINASLGCITETIIERTGNLGLVAPTADRRAGHLTGLRLAAGSSRDGIADIQQNLAEKHVYLSVRGDALRIAPHLHINDTDIDRLVSALADTL